MNEQINISERRDQVIEEFFRGEVDERHNFRVSPTQVEVNPTELAQLNAVAHTLPYLYRWHR